jgi:hypothetical protein
MNLIHEHFRFLAAFLLTLVISCTMSAAAQTATENESATTTTATSTQSATTTAFVERVDSSAVHQEFQQLLERHPPEVGKVLKLDPSLFTNQAYLASYPALAAFLKDHPEVAHSPRYYLNHVYAPGESAPDPASIRLWREMAEGITVFICILTVVLTLSWLIRTLIQHRRWSRLSRIQTEVHNKLLDRFSSNEDLLAYIQTPAGKRFLESAPIPLGEAPRELAAPVNRILWAVQVGVVIAAGGVGLLLISWNVDKDVAQPMFALGVLAMSIGIGFVASGAISYLVSRRLGLWGAQEAAGE